MGKVNAIGIIGALLAIVSVFLAWIKLSIGGIVILEYNGWFFIQNLLDSNFIDNLLKNGLDTSILFVYVPLMVLVFAGLACLLAAFNARAPLAMIGVLIIVFVIYFTIEVKDWAGDTLQIGQLLALAGGVLLVASPIIKKK